MKTKQWFIAAVLLLLFEWLRVYFIMPMPGSQKLNSLDLAYFLHVYRWIFRVLLAAVLVFRLKHVWSHYKMTSLLLLLFICVSAYFTNFPMSADSMFLKMGVVKFEAAAHNKINPERLVLGVVVNGKARAYPIHIIAHHHQVMDTLDPMNPLLPTYCSVCRTGVVYKHPVKNGKPEHLRLVGMDYFNAMFEDETTGSWWQQATGQAIIGKRKGELWTPLPATQTTLANWLNLHPNSLILQEDPAFKEKYKRLEAYDKGNIKSSLLHREKAPGNPKNWMAWVKINGKTKSYAWEALEKQGWLRDSIDGQLFMVASPDGKSLFAFKLPAGENKERYSAQEVLNLYKRCEPLQAAQEFRHSFEHFRK
jgi:hypothetical protein